VNATAISNIVMRAIAPGNLLSLAGDTSLRDEAYIGILKLRK
jgi:hypothetical protein